VIDTRVNGIQLIATFECQHQPALTLTTLAALTLATLTRRTFTLTTFIRIALSLTGLPVTGLIALTLATLTQTHGECEFSQASGQLPEATRAHRKAFAVAQRGVETTRDQHQVWAVGMVTACNFAPNGIAQVGVIARLLAEQCDIHAVCVRHLFQHRPVAPLCTCVSAHLLATCTVHVHQLEEVCVGVCKCGVLHKRRRMQRMRVSE
jgi:hypothetical protein